MMLRLDSLLGIARGLLPGSVGRLPYTLPGGLAHFPPCLSWLGIEFRLDARSDLDLAVSIEGRGPGRQVLAASASQLRAALPAQWRSTLAAIDAWAGATDPALAAATELWLEVDAGAEERPPIVFLTTVGLAATAIEGLLASPVLLHLGTPEPALARLRRACADWQPAIHLHHVASLSPRGRSALRVVASAPRDALASTLAELGWTNTQPELDDLLARLGDWTGRVSFDLDLDDDAPQRLGIEWYLPVSPRTDPRWQQAFSAAQELAGALPDKIEAAREWAEDLAIGTDVVVHRYLHLKFVLRPKEPLSVKGYLGLCPRIHRPGAQANGAS